MLETLAKTIRKFRLQLPIALITVLLSPLAVTAEPNDQSCETAQRQIDQTQHTLLPLKKQQQQIQKHVQTIYQELFACKSRTALSLEQQKHCTHLQEEGAQKFQAMINVITLAHQTSQQLASQTRQSQLSCPAIAAEDTFPKTTSLPILPKNIARNY
jgi:hypothetical protein